MGLFNGLRVHFFSKPVFEWGTSLELLKSEACYLLGLRMFRRRVLVT